MSLFKRRRAEETPLFPPEQFEPVIRCSICTGEQVACMRERESGKLREIMLIRSEADLEEFRSRLGLPDGEIRRIY